MKTTIVLFFLICPFISEQTITYPVPDSECQALADFYTYTNGASWGSPWPVKPPLSGCKPCAYFGVYCSEGTNPNVLQM